MQIPISHRAQIVSPFLAMELMERAKEMEAEGRDIIYLCLGEPDFPTPPAVIEATQQALANGATTYTHSLGLLELRTEIVKYYRQRYAVRLEPEQILVGSGTSPLMLLLFSMLLEEGDELILPDPGYACYPNFVRYAGGTPVTLKTDPQNGFQPRPAEVEALISTRTRGLLINSPSNPAGSILGAAELKALSRLPLPIISDEIYHGLTYEGEEHSILEYSENAFVLNGFSKAYAMTGWRLGFLISPKSCMRSLQTLHQNFMICANHFVQVGGLVALRHCATDIERMRQLYDLRRRQLVRQLRNLGFGIPFMPKGAFYVLADARHIDGDSMRLALDILDKTGVALTPGIDFGAGAEGFLRFSYTSPLEKINEAIQRLTDYLRKIGKLPSR